LIRQQPPKNWLIAASQKLKLNLGLNEVELLKGIVIPLLGQDIFVAGRIRLRL